MINNQLTDREGLAEPPAPKKRRRPSYTLVFLAGLAALSAVGAFIAINNKKGLEWYVSPPIDAQGRRVHILVPTGWTPPDAATYNQIEASRHAPKGAKLMTLWPPNPKQTSLVQRWLQKLHIISSDNPYGLITIQVQPDLCNMYNGAFHLGLTIDGDVCVKDNRPRNGDSTFRAISVHGTGKQALVQYASFAPHRHGQRHLSQHVCEVRGGSLGLESLGRWVRFF